MRITEINLEKVIGLNSKIPSNNMMEFVLVGRSNVGKSSFINAISNRNNYAHTSSTPGKTRTINYYLVNGRFYLVDLPGYGYAKASIEEQNNWATFINKYLKTSDKIEEIILIVDIRHKPSEKDCQMFSFIVSATGYEPIVIATKLDKIKKSEIKKNVEMIRDELGATENCEIIPFSSEKKDGVKDFLKILSRIVDE
ncbi:MAG: YihA family ribosome biogenesis GTP-binding protein [Lachnospiraceae bacterium]|jgi:GTP-binding protein|nr:YihA family ribosome biogenesis GTP-binding protein [Lachnospiraceae bacterium]